MQIFIEPKAKHLRLEEQWKENFLKEISSHAQVQVIFQGRDYSVYGLPFFNTTGPMKQDFDRAMKIFI